MLDNKLNRIQKSLLLVKYAEEQASLQYPDKKMQNNALQNYQLV